MKFDDFFYVFVEFDQLTVQHSVVRLLSWVKNPGLEPVGMILPLTASCSLAFHMKIWIMYWCTVYPRSPIDRNEQGFLNIILGRVAKNFKFVQYAKIFYKFSK